MKTSNKEVFLFTFEINNGIITLIKTMDKIIMQTLTFEFSNLEKNITPISGCIITLDNQSKVVFFNSYINDIHLQDESIRDPLGFLKSVFFTQGLHSEDYETINFHGTEHFIKKQPETETIYYTINDSGFKDVLTNEQVDLLKKTLNTNAFNQVIHQVEVPKDFKYSKNETLNAVLRFNLAPIDYNHSVHKIILEHIRRAKLAGKNEMIYIYRQGSNRLANETSFKNMPHKFFAIPKELLSS